MQRVKFFAAALALALSGAVYAAGYVQNTQNAHGAHGAKAGDNAACCAAHKAEGHQAVMSCDKDGKGCCAAHQAGAQTVSAEVGEDRDSGSSCCAGGGCCGGSCEKGRKAGAAAVKTGAPQGGEGCCPDGACCRDGAACCAAHKAHAKEGSASKQDGEGCCAGCGGGCCSARQEARR